MYIHELIDEYEEGRKEGKEYPNYGVPTVLTKRRKGPKLICRYGMQMYKNRQCLKGPATEMKRKRFRRIRSVATKQRQQPLNLPVMYEEEYTAVNTAVSFIQSEKTLSHVIRSSKTMNVMVELQPGHTLCFTREDSCTVKDIKREIEARNGIPCRVQRLRYLGRPIKDGQTLGDISRGTTDLKLLLFEGQLRGGAPPEEPDSKAAQGGEQKTEMDMLEQFAKQFNKSLADVVKFIEQKDVLVGLGNVEGLVNKANLEKADSPETCNAEDAKTASLSGTCNNLEYLQNNLPGICFSEDNQTKGSKTFCLRYLFGKKGSKANELENKITFLILYDIESTRFGDDERKVIWSEVIQKHTTDWAALLSKDQRHGWDISACDNIVLRNGEQMEFRFGVTNKGSNANVKALPLEALDKSKDNLVILLVDDSVVQSNVTGCFSTSCIDEYNINFEGTTNKPYHAHLSMGENGITVTWGEFMNKSNSEISLPANAKITRHTPRMFKTNPIESHPYIRGSVLDCNESGDEGDLLIPCHEFKLFTHAAKTDLYIHKFCSEVMRFACACLNSRTNGTIHFGIADENPQMSAHENLKPCEIVGVPVLDMALYKDKLTEYINNCFGPENREFARKCIGRPKFISVQPISASATLAYVIEVDIEPHFEFTHNKTFSVSLEGKKNKRVYLCFIRNGSQSSHMSDTSCQSFKVDMKRIDAKRRDGELHPRKRIARNMTRQLQNMLGEDCGKLDNTFKRILVLSSMNNEIRTAEFLEEAKVISNVPWSFVIDFNQNNKSEVGLCQALIEKTDLEIHDAEEFNNDSFTKDAIPPAWVFGNGIHDSSTLPWEKWQLSERMSGLEDLIKKARNEYPPNRSVIMFIVKPGFSKIEAITYGIFLRHFRENAVCFYIEDKETECQWMKYVVNDLRYVDEHKLLCRGIVGLPWEEFIEELKNLTVDCQKGMIQIPLTTMTSCTIARGFLNDRSVQIMDSSECSHLNELSRSNPKRFDQEKRENERQFYSGQEVSMANLWFTEYDAKHVIERDVMKKLDKCFEHVLSTSPHMSQGVEPIRLLCSRGSGGTTVTRSFLWKLFHHEPPYKARCCIVNSIKPETVATVYSYWNYRNSSQLPILALVDGQQDSDFEWLMKGLSEKIENAGSSVIGIAIILLRVESSSHPKEEARERGLNTCVAMDCDLTDGECIRFSQKYEDMQKKHGDGFTEFAQKTLPSFIMMMHRSKEDKQNYARRIVESALPDLNDSERDMLKFLSLIHISVPEDHYIYIASFDPIMTSFTFRKERFHVNWSKNLSKNAEMFLKYKDLYVSEDAYSDTEPGVSITFCEFAEAILTWALSNQQKHIGDIAIDFMNSAAFPASSEIPRTNEFTRCLYFQMYTALIGNRKPMKSGRKKDIFSKLISRILQEKCLAYAPLDKALEVMKLGFEKMKRPALAQQVARIAYIDGAFKGDERKIYFEIAEEWIQRALSEKRKYYFLDTAGRIRLRKLQVYFGRRKGQLKLDRTDKYLEALDLCLDSIKWFQESQKADHLGKVLRPSLGYFGEMQAMYYFLSLLANSKAFDYSPNNVRKYICNAKWKPRQLPWSEAHENQLKQFRERYMYCLMKIEESKSILKIEDEVNIFEYEAQFKEYFVFIDREDLQDDLARYKQNWMCIQQHIGAGIFMTVFNLSRIKARPLKSAETIKDLSHIRELLTANMCLDVDESLKRDDILLLMIVKLALYSPFRSTPLPKEKAIQEFIETKANMEALLQKEERINEKNKSYCVMLNFMFQWPHDDLLSQNYLNGLNDWEPGYYATLHKLETMAIDFQRKYQILDTDTGEFCRRQALKHMPKHSPVSTLFYLGNGRGLDMYVHLNELVSETYGSLGINWEHPYINKRLRQLSGERISKREIKFTTGDKRFLTIPVNHQWHSRFSLEEVSFYVGFSWRGLLAHGVSAKR